MRKIIFGLAVVAMAATASAFTSKTIITSKSSSSTWIFTGDESQILEADHYSQNISEPNGCGALTAELPCTVNFPSNVDNKSALESYLENPSRTESDVIDLAETMRKANP